MGCGSTPIQWPVGQLVRRVALVQPIFDQLVVGVRHVEPTVDEALARTWFVQRPADHLSGAASAANDDNVCGSSTGGRSAWSVDVVLGPSFA
jgi:hypothetical protein